MSVSSNDMRPAFDVPTADFDALGAHLWEPIGAATVAATAPAAGERVFDACCGTGASAIAAAQKVGVTGRVDAVDRSKPMIDKLVGRSRDLPQLHAYRADVTAWRGSGYDVVQCALGIVSFLAFSPMSFPDVVAGTEGLVRRARPGGRVGLTIWRHGALEVAARHLARAVARVAHAAPPPRVPPPLDQIGHPDRYAAWLRARGLSTVDVITSERRLVMTTEAAWRVVMGSGYRAVLVHLSPRQVQAVRATYLESLHDAGVFDLDVTTLIGVGTRDG